MKIKYFPDTDTAFFESSNQEVSETKELNENIYVDIDDQGNLVSMTIEHAGLPDLSGRNKALRVRTNNVH